MFERPLRLKSPAMTGGDVAQLQLRLLELGYAYVGVPDGIFGRNTDKAVKDYQRRQGLIADGIVGRTTWGRLFEINDEPRVVNTRPVHHQPAWLRALPDLVFPHSFRDSVSWFLAREGVIIANRNVAERFMGGANKIESLWRRYDDEIESAAEEFHVPVELIIATIMTESNGDARALRTEPGFRSDQSTPDKVSAGLMQTLISTAEYALGEHNITRQWLYQPRNSIRAGTAYIASQWPNTTYDPPKVACAYNAGGIYYNPSQANRWRMRQYPIGTSHHADRYIKWFNDTMDMFGRGSAPRLSFSAQ